MKTPNKLFNTTLSIAIISALGLAAYLQIQFTKLNEQISNLNDSIATTNILLSDDLLEPAAGSIEPDIQSGVVLYKMLENVQPNQLKSLNGLLKGQGLLKEMPMGPSGVTMARFDGSSHGREKAISKMLQKSGLVAFAEPDYKVELSVEANDSDFTDQWHHKVVKTPNAWEVTTGDRSVLVAVCDTGVDTDHPDLADNLRMDLAWNAHEDSTYVRDTNGHGTGTIGVLGALGNNYTGVAGINWNVDIIPIRIAISDSNSGAYTSTMAKCIEYAADQGAKIVNMSYTGVYSSTVDSASQYLRDKGGLLFMAAANSGEEQTWPDFPSSIAVAATDQNNERASFSNWGEFVDITAPGVSIRTTYKNNSYTNYSGTSFSSPLVAGIGALMVAVNPNITPSEIENGLLSTAVNIGDEYIFGSGLANAEAAVQYALNLAGDAPTADMYYSALSSPYGENITFSAAHSFDTDGKITSYLWEFGDGNTSPEIDTVHSYDKAGAYNVTLKVTDNDGLINTAQQIIQVTNEIPVIESLTTDFIEGDIPLDVTFNQITTDSDGEIVSYVWDFGDGIQSNEANPNHTYTSQGNFDARLTVTDNAGGQNSKAVTINAIDPNYEPLSAPTNLSYNLNGSEITLTWEDNSIDESNFVISKYNPETGFYKEFIVNKDVTELTNTISYTSQLSFKVWAIDNSDYESEKSNSVELCVVGTVDKEPCPENVIALAAPSNLEYTIKGSDVRLSWQDNSNDEAGFIITKFNPDTGFYKEFTVGNDITEFSNTISYTSQLIFTVKAFDNEGINSSKSNSVEFCAVGTVDQKPCPESSVSLEAPSNLQFIINGSDVTFNWQDNSNEETAFIVSKYNPDTGFYKEFTVDKDTTEFVNTVKYTSQLIFKVKAINDTEESANSKPVEFCVVGSIDQEPCP